MNPRFYPLIVPALEIVCFGSGIVVRLRAAGPVPPAAGGSPNKLLEGVIDPGSYSDAASLSQAGDMASEIAVPLLWTGGALVVASASAQLFLPALRFRRPAPAEPGPRAGDRPFLSNPRPRGQGIAG